MSKNKLHKFKELSTLTNTIQPDKNVLLKDQFYLKGNWNKIFKNNNPISLELGCGYGEYTYNLARKFKNENFVGIDIKGSRIWKGAKSLESIQSKNAIFLRIQIENILDFFMDNEIKEILIAFPDPRQKKRDVKKRLTNLSFLNKYHKILDQKGKLILKTDDDDLFKFSIEEIEKSKFDKIKITKNLYQESNFLIAKNVKTKYEKKFLNQGKKIKYLETSK